MEAVSFGIPEVALQLLQGDMQRLEDRMRDEKFARELYRALANNIWTKDGESAALSWKRAEELINAVRRGLGATPLTLAETGGEGTVDRSVREAFAPLGWRIEPLDTSRRDPAHLDSPEDPPPDEAAIKRLRRKR
ncbi:MAG TPA: hypothetical protein VIG37_23920 [Methylomirabilota bacterium]|jgi:hypothetical protein